MKRLKYWFWSLFKTYECEVIYDDTKLCYKCEHRKFRTTEGKIKDEPCRDLGNCDIGEHFCKKHKSILKIYKPGTDLTLPIKNCIGSVRKNIYKL